MASAAVGQRLLHVTIDQIAAEAPDRAWASIPKSNNISDGYRDVSFAEFANAINRLSWFLESHLGPDRPKFKTLAYMGLPDMRYHIMSMAAAKTECKVSYHSNADLNRNSGKAQCGPLLETLDVLRTIFSLSFKAKASHSNTASGTVQFSHA
jgi:hypothetical protein